MNTQDYIKSGILEAYALGLVSVEEQMEIEILLANNAELRSELSKIEADIERSAMASAVAPPTFVKENVMASIASADVKVVQMNTPSSNNSYKWLAAASIVLLIGSGMLNVVFYNKYNSSQSELAAIQSKSSVLAEDLSKASLDKEKMKNDLAMVSAPDIRVIQMKGLPKSPESMVTVFWKEKSNEVYIAINALPKPADDKQYQLWAIVDGQPVDAGMIDLADESALHKMKNMNAAQAFAITLEPKGGSVSPTLEEMYVMAGV